jgi:nucleoside-diphosphate-sugar epimerase
MVGYDAAMAEGGTVLVIGGGGFIGGHLVAELLRQGRQVRSVDCKPLPAARL